MVVEESPHKKDAGQADSKEDRRGVLSGALCQRRRAPCKSSGVSRRRTLSTHSAVECAVTGHGRP